MAVLLVDLADRDPAPLSAAAAAAAWTRATGTPALSLRLSDGATGFVAAIGGGEQAGGHPAGANPTVYAAASDLGGPGAVADLLAGGGGRVVLATATDGVTAPDGGAAVLVELAVRGGLDRWEADRAAEGLAGLEGAVALLAAARAALGTGELVGAVDTDAPLLGLNGVAATGTWTDDRAARQAAEGRLGALADLLHRASAVSGPTRLLPAPRASAVPGAGSGGGLGHALALLGGRLTPAVEVVAGAVGLAGRVEDAELVVAVTPELGPREMSGGLVSVLGPLAAAAVVPLVVVAGRSVAGRREWSAAGVSAVYEAGETTLERVARTWTPTAPGGSTSAVGS